MLQEYPIFDIDADHGDCAAGFLRHRVFLFGAPSQIRLLAGLEHGTISGHSITR
jgi:hypothetical protein